jgi:hypothetical protein
MRARYPGLTRTNYWLCAWQGSTLRPFRHLANVAGPCVRSPTDEVPVGTERRMSNARLTGQYLEVIMAS